jgi:hypothetical protein
VVDIKSAVGALRSDADSWDGAAQDGVGPQQTIGSLGLTGQDVSMYGMDAGIETTYAGAQSALQNML